MNFFHTKTTTHHAPSEIISLLAEQSRLRADLAAANAQIAKANAQAERADWRLGWAMLCLGVTLGIAVGMSLTVLLPTPVPAIPR